MISNNVNVYVAFIVKAGPTGRGELYYFYMFNNEHLNIIILGVGYVMLFMLPRGWEGVK